MPGSAVDGWSVAHILVGAALSILRIPRPTAYAIIILTEVAELALRRSGVDFFQESERNVAADLVFSAGAYEVHRLGRGAS